MLRNNLSKYIGIACISLLFTACSVKSLVKKTESKEVPAGYASEKDTANVATLKWKEFFTDPNLVALIDTALIKNQELNIFLQEISIAKNEVRARKGMYLPFVNGVGNAGVWRTPQYTSQGASDAVNDITPGQKVPVNLPNYSIGLTASWELDIWKKLRNSKKAAFNRFLATQQGRNFLVTQLIAEVANSYYELMAYDNQLEILKNNIQIQQNALEIVKLEKQAAKVTELAVRRFEAEVLKNQSRQYYIEQSIIETQNKINYLLGRFPQPIVRSSATFLTLSSDTLHIGVPSQLLANRPDVMEAEQRLIASKLDVKSAKAYFYPTLMVNAGLGYQAFDLKYLITSPESLVFGLAGQLMAPLINRNAIKATYYTANNRQVQAAYNYERTILNAYIEVANQQANISNLEKSYTLQTQQVQALTRSIDISTGLFKSARADYMEVLLVQRDALQAKFELIETKRMQLNARVNIYQALGGGW
ncbi:MAG: efflux transporter outer rane subunit [Chitinophagaceae bacterium]|nr:efflux transporter outer rane subunit [Chitinophagaceae bacterium]